MSSIASLASLAALVGEPARTAMLVTLMDGRALTAGELGDAAGVTPSTASGHLAQLLDAGLLALERQGRHRYYRLASAAVAETLEGMMALAGGLGVPRRTIVTGPRDRALRHARLCYDHLAGTLAVAIADTMAARGQLDFDGEGGALTASGAAFLKGLGVDLTPTSGPKFCRPCLDWSERRPHIAGTVGRALYAGFLQHGWLHAPSHGRAVTVTPRGAIALERHFGTLSPPAKAI
jgi:DNA-binding transcriptional ArsR family regulator